MAWLVRLALAQLFYVVLVGVVPLCQLAMDCILAKFHGSSQRMSLEKRQQVVVLPTGPRNPSRPGVEVFGDPEAVAVLCELVRSHGWTPVVRGGIEVAHQYEGGLPTFGKLMGNLYREIAQGEKLSVGW